MLPSVAPLNVSSGCIPFNFLCKQRLRLFTLRAAYCLTAVVHVILLATPEGEFYRLMSGDRTGHSAILPFLTTFPEVSSLRCAVSCQNVEARRCVVSTFALLFQEARTLNKHGFILQKFSSSKSSYEYLNKGDTSRKLPSVR
jgi:hypothetical protein